MFGVSNPALARKSRKWETEIEEQVKEIKLNTKKQESSNKEENTPPVNKDLQETLSMVKQIHEENKKFNEEVLKQIEEMKKEHKMIADLISEIKDVSLIKLAETMKKSNDIILEKIENINRPIKTGLFLAPQLKTEQ